jgi:hypothetical protein
MRPPDRSPALIAVVGTNGPSAVAGGNGGTSPSGCPAREIGHGWSMDEREQDRGTDGNDPAGDTEPATGNSQDLTDDELRVAEDPDALAAAERAADAMPPEGAPPPPGAPPQDVVVLGSWSVEEAYLIEGRLRADGIEAWVDRDNFAREEGTALRTLASVLVPPDRAEEAARIVRDADELPDPQGVVPEPPGELAP